MPLPDGPPAVDINGLAGDKIRSRRSQKYDDSFQLGQVTPATHGSPFIDEFKSFRVLADLGDQFGFKIGGADGIYARTPSFAHSSAITLVIWSTPPLEEA